MLKYSSGKLLAHMAAKIPSQLTLGWGQTTQDFIFHIGPLSYFFIIFLMCGCRGTQT